LETISALLVSKSHLRLRWYQHICVWTGCELLSSTGDNFCFGPIRKIFICRSLVVCSDGNFSLSWKTRRNPTISAPLAPTGRGEPKKSCWVSHTVLHSHFSSTSSPSRFA